MAFALKYDDAIHLDAESLAEGGIAEGYQSVLPELRRFVPHPATLYESLDDDTPSYSVRCGDSEFDIYSPELDEQKGNSWGRATVALFSIVNEQLENSTHRFYAINGGNDLSGVFLTPAEAVAAQATLRDKRDWPYLPKDEHPWYGQYH
jgi:hypothetical protein